MTADTVMAALAFVLWVALMLTVGAQFGFRQARAAARDLRRPARPEGDEL